MKTTAAAICLCMVLFAALPASAGEDEKKFFVGVEATYLQPSGDGLEFVLDDPVLDGLPEGDIRTVDFDAGLAPRVILGWTDPSGGRLFATWWNWDDDATGSVVNQEGGSLHDILMHPSWSYEIYTGGASGAASIDAEVIDLGYSRVASGSKRFAARWIIGLRHASLDRSFDVLYDYLGGEFGNVEMGSEMEGLGITGGLRGVFKITDNLYVTGGMQYALMRGDLDLSTFMYYDDDPANLIADVTRESDTAFSTCDTHIALIWEATEMLYLWGGYEFSQWNNAAGKILFPDDVHPGFIQTEKTDITWDGFMFGVGLAF
jgi:hypothetical protein